MRVDIEKGHLDSYKSIAQDANKALKGKKVAKADKYKRLVEQRNISVEYKKEKLAKSLHELIIKAFSINISRINDRKRAVKSFKANTDLIRSIVKKIESINHYLEESLLKELGIIKKSLVVEAAKAKDPVKYLESKGRVLPKEYIGKLEHAVYELMQKIVFFDKKLIKDYRKKDVRVIGNEKLEIKGLQKVLLLQTELLEALEAKLPPSAKVKPKLFTKAVFNYWAPMVFALLSSFETEYSKEKEIFSIIKKSYGLRKKIEGKIRHVIAEKEKILKIKEKRALSMGSLKGINEDYRQAFHEYISAASL
ncbi:MAG: hypothetical protein AABX34_04510 [Nanoarchaeota archaeon]